MAIEKARPRRRRFRGINKREQEAKLQKRRLVRALMFIVPVAIAFPVAMYLYGSGKLRSEQQAMALRPLSELRYESGRAATSSIGEEFFLDGFRYRVTGAASRGRTFGYQHASGKFIQVAIHAVNAGDSTAAPADISMVHQDGTAYAELQQFSMNDTSYSQVRTEGLEPSDGGVYFALFDVASDSSNVWLSFHSPDGMSARIVSLGL